MNRRAFVALLSAGAAGMVCQMGSAIAVRPSAIATALPLNDECFVAFDSLESRCHVWDPTTVRRRGVWTVSAEDVPLFPYRRVIFGPVL